MSSKLSLILLFPAQAGVILFVQCTIHPVIAIPRTGGGDPNCGLDAIAEKCYSPHRRG